jgi:putative hydrolase of the HAD superfamily
MKDESGSRASGDGKAIRTIVFDFGNVVGFFSHRRAAEQLAAYGDVAPEAIQAFLFGNNVEDDYESGRLSTPQLMNLVRDHFRLRCTDEQFAVAFGDMFWPNDEVCGLVPRLARRHRLLLLSNTNELHARVFLKRFRDTLRHFDALVLSHQVGVRKPDPRVYARCRGLAGTAARECLFIDDLPSNVEAARACGWQGLVYERGMDLGAALAGLGVHRGACA